LLESDDAKFSLSTPARVSTAYLQVIDPETSGSSSSERILQDCKKWMGSLEVIREAGGAIVEGVGNRSGHRALNVPGCSSNWGGLRVKQPPKPMKWLHSDAEG
jgi:hypothetical protein